jgi:hypothetical protein
MPQPGLRGARIGNEAFDSPCSDSLGRKFIAQPVIGLANNSLHSLAGRPVIKVLRKHRLDAIGLAQAASVGAEAI